MVSSLRSGLRAVGAGSHVEATATALRRRRSLTDIHVVDLRPHLDHKTDALADLRNRPQSGDVLPVDGARRPTRECLVLASSWSDRCRSQIIAARQRCSADLPWDCQRCGVSGVIRGWKDSVWDGRRSDGR
jgi:hypothetical protein